MRSTKTATDTTLSNQTFPVIRPSSTFHQSCNTLTLDRFFNILISGNLVYLVIKGEVPSDELISAWEKIAEEYAVLLNHDEVNTEFDLFRKIKATQTKLFYIDVAIDYLKHEYDYEIAEGLTLLGFPMIEELPDRKDYLGQIFRVETEAKYLIVLLNQYTSEYNMLNKDEKIQRTVSDYEKEVQILSKYQGYRIRKEQTTVMEYCAIVNNYIQFNKISSAE